MAAPPSKGPPKPLLIVGALLALYAGYKLYKEHGPHEWSGTIEAHTIDVGSRTGGRVKSVVVHEGDIVKEGDTLVVLETGDLDAQRLIAQGQLDQAQAALEKAEKGARPEEIEQANARAMASNALLQQYRTGARTEQVGAAKARFAAAQATAEKAQLDAERARTLFSSGSISKAELDSAETALRGANAQRDAAKDTASELENGTRREEIQQASAHAIEAQASAKLVQAGTRVEDLKAARGVVLAAQGKLDSINTAIGELTIKAPRAARVESLDLRPGDLLNPSATAARLLEEDELYVRLYVPETEVGKVSLGSEIAVRVDSFDRTFKGRVEHVNSIGEYTPRNLQTREERTDQVFGTKVRMLEGKGQLRSGMAAFVRAP